MRPIRVATPAQALPALLASQVRAQLEGGNAQLEYRFDEMRRWRFDLAWPAERVAVEIEGGAWVRGRHTRGKGFVADLEKYNEAVCAGWRVLRVTPDQVRDGSACELACRVLARAS